MKINHYQFYQKKTSHLVRDNYNFHLKIIVLALLCYSSQSNATEITIASDIWCPYICQDKQKPGYIVEMMNDILQDKQFTIKNQTMPLVRAIKRLQSGDVDIVLGLTRQHIDHDNLIRSNMSVGNSANDFFVNPNNAWRFTTVAQLAKYASAGHKIGIIKGYYYGVHISELMTKSPRLFAYSHGNAPLEQNINRLKSGRIKILLDSKNSVLNEVKRLNISALTYAGTQGEESKLYVALSIHSFCK